MLVKALIFGGGGYTIVVDDDQGRLKIAFKKLAASFPIPLAATAAISGIVLVLWGASFSSDSRTMSSRDTLFAAKEGQPGARDQSSFTWGGSLSWVRNLLGRGRLFPWKKSGDWANNGKRDARQGVSADQDAGDGFQQDQGEAERLTRAGKKTRGAGLGLDSTGKDGFAPGSAVEEAGGEGLEGESRWARSQPGGKSGSASGGLSGRAAHALGSGYKGRGVPGGRGSDTGADLGDSSRALAGGASGGGYSRRREWMPVGGRAKDAAGRFREGYGENKTGGDGSEGTADPKSPEKPTVVSPGKKPVYGGDIGRMYNDLQKTEAVVVPLINSQLSLLLRSSEKIAVLPSQVQAKAAGAVQRIKSDVSVLTRVLSKHALSTDRVRELPLFADTLKSRANELTSLRKAGNSARDAAQVYIDYLPTIRTHDDIQKYQHPHNVYNTIKHTMGQYANEDRSFQDMQKAHANEIMPIYNQLGSKKAELTDRTAALRTQSAACSGDCSEEKAQLEKAQRELDEIIDAQDRLARQAQDLSDVYQPFREINAAPDRHMQNESNNRTASAINENMSEYLTEAKERKLKNIVHPNLELSADYGVGGTWRATQRYEKASGGESASIELPPASLWYKEPSMGIHADSIELEQERNNVKVLAGACDTTISGLLRIAENKIYLGAYLEDAKKREPPQPAATGQ